MLACPDRIQGIGAGNRISGRGSTKDARRLIVETEVLLIGIDVPNLLEDMLQLNPGFRPTAQEMLRNSIFNSVRNESKEESCPENVKLSVYSDSVYDYENDKAINWTQQDVRSVIAEDAHAF